MKMEEFEALIERSRRFRETANFQADMGFHDLAVFSLEQSLQLFLKAILLKLGADYPRIHGIRKLIEIIYRICGNNAIGELLTKYSVELGALEDAYISSRYALREYTSDEFKRLSKVVNDVMNIVRSNC